MLIAPSFQTYFHIDPNNKIQEAEINGNIVSVLQVGCLFGSLLATGTAGSSRHRLVGWPFSPDVIYRCSGSKMQHYDSCICIYHWRHIPDHRLQSDDTVLGKVHLWIRYSHVDLHITSNLCANWELGVGALSMLVPVNSSLPTCSRVILATDFR